MPAEKRRALVRERLRSPRTWNAILLFGVAGAIWVYYAVTIQERWNLYRTSSTMTLFGCTLAVTFVIILWLRYADRPRLAWLAAILLPLAAGESFTALTDVYPPSAPMGW